MNSSRELYRSIDHRRIGGVCAGIAARYGLGETAVRLTFIVLSLLAIGVPLYLLLWIVMPKDPAEGYAGQRWSLPGIFFRVVVLLGIALFLTESVLETEGSQAFFIGLAIGLVWLLVNRSFGWSDGEDRWRRRPGAAEARIAGVAATIAARLDVPATVIRIGLVLMTFVAFPWVPLLYVAAAIVLPRYDRDRAGDIAF